MAHFQNIIYKFPKEKPSSSLSLLIFKIVSSGSDQGCQFTSNEYKNFLAEHKVKQSMDGKSRWADNIMIERWFRSLKYEEVYLTEYRNIKEARAAIGKYIYNYNFNRCPSSIGNVPPASAYYPMMLYNSAVESFQLYAA